MSSALMLLWASSSYGYLVRGSSDAAAAGPGNAREPLSHWTELTAASYDPEVAARAMWWSMVASYDNYKLQKRKIGKAHLQDKVWLHPSNEVLVFRDGPDAYVIFRGLDPVSAPSPPHIANTALSEDRDCLCFPHATLSVHP